MIVHGRLPAGWPPEDDDTRRRTGWGLRALLDRIRCFGHRSSGDPALVAYLGAHESVLERMLPEAPLARLEKLRADLFDGRIAPSLAYFTMVITAATILSQHLQKSAALLLALRPPAQAERAFRRLLALHEAAERATDDVLDAASRGDFDLLQDKLFELTRDVAVLRRSAEGEHRRLARAVQTGSCIPVLVAQTPEELPSNVIPLFRSGELDSY